jgi:hypothetical protein
MRTLYFSTPPEVPNEPLEIPIRFSLPLLEGGEIFGVLGERQLYSVVDDLRDRVVGGRRLHPQRPMNFRVEIDGGSLG